ncbi:LOG family protein [Caviibacter abscessus]|uniref:LOG family protein n=1 Tax=Caviibacter abscessus TaxID=1766719 RepID=UPI00082BAB09|nr:TIGR00730 family Rossman fold protein [Caviibacter abscessus]
MNITVYCGAHIGSKKIYSEKTKELGLWILKNNYTLVYGGGRVGLMGILSNEIMSNGGNVIGVMPKFLVEKEIANPNLTKLVIVESMPERKQYMIEKADVFIALPGGPGTLEEISEVISWARIGKNSSPCIVYNIDGYYNPLKKMFDDMVENGFLSKEDRENTLFSDNMEEIERFIKNYKAPIFDEYK